MGLGKSGVGPRGSGEGLRESHGAAAQKTKKKRKVDEQTINMSGGTVEIDFVYVNYRKRRRTRPYTQHKSLLAGQKTKALQKVTYGRTDRWTDGQALF